MKNFNQSKIEPPNDPRAGESTLVTSAVFSEHGLSLYCDVPVSDMKSRKDSTPWAASCDKERIDYLVCRGGDVIMAIEVTDRDELLRGVPIRVEDLYFAETTEEQMAQCDVSAILAQLSKLLEKAEPPVWTCSLHPVEPSEPLFDGRLLEWTMDSASCWFVAPSEYGVSMGIVKAYRHSSGEIQCVPMCSPRISKRLEEILDPGAYPVADRGRIPFAERMQAIKSGLPGNSIHSVSAVREIMDTPLDAYMFEFTQEHEKLFRALPRHCRANTYGEAALAIYDSLRLDATEEALLLMRVLTEPIATEYQASIGARLVADMTGNMPERKHIVASAGAGPSLEERIQRLKQPANPGVAAVGSFLNLSLESFFQGVSLLAGMPYPLWLAERLKAVYDLSDGYPYGWLIAHANREAAEEDEERAADGEELLYRLAIEPFAFIRKNQKNKEELTENE